MTLGEVMALGYGKTLVKNDSPFLKILHLPYAMVGGCGSGRIPGAGGRRCVMPSPLCSIW